MARPNRLHVPAAFYHVMLRGNDKQSIFASDADRYKLQELIADGVERYGHSIHAYCWMENHIHMVVRVGDIPLSKIMHNLAFRYTSYFNWRHGHVGHLFQGRYKALLVDADEYLLQLTRYIHRNPVRAGIAVRAGEHAWSSHRCYMGYAGQSWLETDYVLGLFAQDRKLAIERYACFMDDEFAAEGAIDFKRGMGNKPIIGDALFRQEVMDASAMGGDAGREDVLAICAAVCLAAGISTEALRSGSSHRTIATARAAAAFVAATRHECPLTLLGALLKRDGSTLCRLVRQMRLGGADDPARQLAARAEAILANQRVQRLVVSPEPKRQPKPGTGRKISEPEN